MPRRPTRRQQPGIFLSYRRSDAAGHAGRLYDRLTSRFGRTRVFMDVEAIAPGTDFEEEIRRSIQSCGVLLAIVGRKWLESGPPGTASREAVGPGDFVRLEITTALDLGVPVIPVLVQRAPMPAPSEVPKDLEPFCRLQAIELDDTRWDADVDRLLGQIERSSRVPESLPDPASGAPGRRRVRLVMAAAAFALVGIAVTLALLFVGGGGSPRKAPPVATCDGVVTASGGAGKRASSTTAILRSLRPGGTTCVAGVFTGDLAIAASGTRRSPIVIRSASDREPATVRGNLTVRGEEVVIEGLNIEGAEPTQPTVWILANGVELLGNDITNNHRGLTCVYVNGPLRRIRIVGNLIHDCATPDRSSEEAVGTGEAQRITIADNFIYDSAGFGILLYPKPDGAVVRHNTIVGTGNDSIRLGSDETGTTNNDLIVDNIVAESRGYLVGVDWGGEPGNRDRLIGNCFWNPSGDIIADPSGSLVVKSSVTAGANLFTDPRGGFRPSSASGCSSKGVRFDAARRVPRQQPKPATP